MKLTVLVLLTVSASSGQEISYICSPSSIPTTALYLGNRLGKRMTRWTCLLKNATLEQQVVAESDLLFSLMSHGVPATATAHVLVEMEEATRRGGWRTSARVLGDLTVAMALMASSGAVQLSAAEMSGLAIGGLLFPSLAEALGRRPPTAENLASSSWAQPLGLDVGRSAMVVMWSERAGKHEIVRGEL